MRAFTVIPDELRRTALIFGNVIRPAEGQFRMPWTRTLGHEALCAAVDDFAGALAGGWTEAVASVDDVASGLREVASMYERVDDDADVTLKALQALL